MADRGGRPFWLDWDYDRDNADTGSRSRYDDYLQQSRAFAEIYSDNPTVEFAVNAWRVATGPIMVPPLVRRHPRISDVRLARSDWNGELICDVQLISPPPAVLGRTTPSGDYYRGHRLSSWGEYEWIGEDDVARGPYLLAEVQLLWQLPPGTLPAIKRVPVAGVDLYQRAVECLEILVGILNREVGPIIHDLGN